MAEMKRLRDVSGLSQDAVADELGWHASKLMRIETGRTAPHPNDVRLMLEVYGLADKDVFAALVKLARDARQRGWWYSYRDVLLSRYDFFIGLESEAATIRNFVWAMVPGLLQTECYARALIAGASCDLSPDEVERRVEVRMTRQEVLSKGDRPDLWAILDESVIRRPIGGRGVMRAQLRHLISAGGEGRTIIQVVPYSAGPHSGLAGSFVALGFIEVGEPDVVYLETVGGNLYVDKPEEAHLYTTAFDHLRASAMSPDDTRALLRATADGLE